MSMKHGDFTDLAKKYKNRPAYNKKLLNFISKQITSGNSNCNIAEIGAGTGKLTKMLAELDFSVSAVEPNDEMRKVGQEYINTKSVQWYQGTGENTKLDSGSYDWVIMASSFHWTDPNLSLPEFYRLLKPNGYLTIIWNPRNIKISKLHVDIENIIYSYIPNMKRKSSGERTQTETWENVLTQTGHFKDVIFSEISFMEQMSIERYMGAWESVNDIRVQAGEENFKKILKEIENAISHLDGIISVPYKNTSWTAQIVD